MTDEREIIRESTLIEALDRLTGCFNSWTLSPRGGSVNAVSALVWINHELQRMNEHLSLIAYYAKHPNRPRRKPQRDQKRKRSRR